MGGKKRAKQLFQKHTNSASKKCWGKNRRKKVRKTFFYIHTNTVNEKWGGEKSAKQFFQKHTNNASKKCWEKNCRKKCEKRFLYSHEYREKNCWGKKARINFSRNTPIVRAKNVGEKIFGKK